MKTDFPEEVSAQESTTEEKAEVSSSPYGAAGTVSELGLEEAEGWKGWQRGLLIVLLLFLAGAGTAGLWLLFWDGDDDPEVAHTLVGEETPFVDLRIGSCFNLPENDLVANVYKVGCRTSHEAELIGRVVHPAVRGDVYPGDDEMDAWAGEVCEKVFVSFLGPAAGDGYFVVTPVPPAERYFEEDNVRDVECLLKRADGGVFMGKKS